MMLVKQLTAAASLDETERCAYIGYLGHDTELLSDTVENNILLGGTGDVKVLLRAVRLEREVTPETRIGAGGVRLSGGQQQRLALARQLANLKPPVLECRVRRGLRLQLSQQDPPR